jgi:hypothetical protein
VVGVVTAIGDHTSNRTCRLDQLIGNADVADVTRCEADNRRATQNIGQDMDFCGLTTP